MKAKFFTLLLLVLPLLVLGQSLSYEQQGDELFAQAQYEKAEKKYKAAIEMSGTSSSLKTKKENSSKCASLLSRAKAAEESASTSTGYENASKLYSDLFAIHALQTYKNKANTLKQKANAIIAQQKKTERDRAISKADGYVDLGLPSGTLWKTENEDCGLVTYDKAYELYGNSLPTYEQLKELNDKCQWIWKGNGYKIIGKNGETIFMPAAGYRPCDGPMKLVGSYGYCWASTPVGSEKAWRLGFCSNNVFLNPLYRCYSFSVRLVR